MPIVKTSFRAPVHNIELLDDYNRRIYFKANLEFADGILPILHGGTGNNGFANDQVIIYSDGKLISSGVTKAELSTLSGIPTENEDHNSVNMVDLLNSKVSGITTEDNTLLDKNPDTNIVKLPPFLNKTGGGTVNGNVEVTGSLTIANVIIEYDEVTESIVFKKKIT